MYDQNKPLETTCGEPRQSPAHRLAECAHASLPVVASGAQHSSRLADSAQPSSCERENAGCRPTDVEGFRLSGCGNGRHEGQSCAEKRLASLGDATGERRQPVHPQGQEDVVKPHGPVSTENVLQLLEHQQYRCALTGRRLTPETAALDHIIPVRRDGEHVIENTQVLHKDVNRAKGSLTNEEFIGMCREVVDHATHQRTKGGAK